MKGRKKIPTCSTISCIIIILLNLIFIYIFELLWLLDFLVDFKNKNIIARNTNLNNLWLGLCRFIQFMKRFYLVNVSPFKVHIYTWLEILIILLLLVYLFNLIISIYYLIYLPVDPIFNMTDVPIPPSDPVRPWPTGVTQAFGSVTGALGAYFFLNKFSTLSPRGRAIGALVAGGVGSGHLLYNSILENSVGFNRLMWGVSEYKKTGSWPSIDLAYAQTAEKLDLFAAAERAKITPVEQAAIEASVDKVLSTTNNGSTLSITPVTTSGSTSGSSGVGNSFLPSSDSSSLMESLLQLYENLFRQFMELFGAVPVQGHFDDLVGQRMFVEFILFTSCIFVSILFILFIFNLIFVFNKDRILNKFKSKYVRWFIEYEIFVSRITLVVFPLLILLGLYTIGSGLV